MKQKTAPVEPRSWTNSFALTGMNADERQMDAEQRDQDRNDGGAATAREHRRAGVPHHLAAQPQGEHDDPGAGQRRWSH